MKNCKGFVFSCLLLLGAIQSVDAMTLDVQVNKTIAEVNPDMYGVFFEDINFGADGGLYAELIKNRSFEFPQNLMGWKTFGNVSLMQDGPFERNPHYVRLGHSGHEHKHTGLENEGFRGIGFQKGADYRFSVWARATSGEQRIRVEFVDEGNTAFSRQECVVEGSEWKKYEWVIHSNREVEKGLLRIFLTSEGSMDLEHISLFPVETWKGRSNGMRMDLAQALCDLKPGVFRFPGGCIVEGTDLDTRYDWKKSVGPIENRPLNENRWHYTFPHRFFPDYFQTYGLGFYEYFLLSEDFGAEPLPVLNVGLSCQYQNNSMDCHVSVDQLDAYVQDALDLIEFANGSVETTWGKLRAEMGHPEPFHLKYLGVGNEQWGPEYPERLEVFVNAIRAAHPSIQIVGSSGPSAEGDRFDFLWPEMKRLQVDLVDEHYYKDPNWFFNNAKRYDGYDRKGPKVFAGEYASHHSPSKKANNFLSALSEAAFMTGLERNADVVRLATYAPLFAHVDAWQWNPDMIWFDNLRSMRTPNYYVQQLYSLHKGTHVLSALSEGQPLAGQDGLYATVARDEAKNTLIVKIVNKNNRPQSIHINLKGFKQAVSKASMWRMQSDDLMAVHAVGEPETLKPETFDMELVGNAFDMELLSQSFYVLEIQLSKEKTRAKGKKAGLHRVSGVRTVFTIGDSTVRNGDGSGRNGQWGWGAFLGQYLDSTYCVENRALGGRSSRTYISEGLWANTLSRVQTGDYVLMQFGHNDGGEPHRGRARATLKGNGDESKEYVMEQSGDTVAIHSYGWYMRQYIRDTKAKGAISVVVSLIPRNRWSNGKVERSTDTYAGWAKQAAEAEGALFIDLNALVSDKYDVLGKSFVDNLYYGDHTHTSLTGAQLNASIVAEELLKLVE